MSKYVLFYNELLSLTSSLDPVEVKLAIGDSINNNRTLTVGQVVRYLTSKRNKKLRSIGNSLAAVNGIIGAEVKNSRNNFRTDAVDINEFLNFYGEEVIGAGSFANTIGRTVSISA